MSITAFLLTLGLGVTAVIHLLPLLGLLSAAQLERLYGLTLTDDDLVLLMRHRALLFGLLGALCLAAIVRPELVPAALIGGWISVTGFLGLAGAGSRRRTEIRRVIRADWIAVLALTLATGAWLAG